MAHVSLPVVELQVARSAPKKLVVEAVVVKREVEVALVPVALVKVKFWRVVEPETRRSPDVLMEVVAEPPTLNSLALNLPPKKAVEVPAVPVNVEREVRPERTERVPVKLAAEEIVWLLIKPEVMAPVFSEVEKRLVLDAVVAKELVVVAPPLAKMFPLTASA